MKLIQFPLKDTYITNKIVNYERKTNANVGDASTLDIFKLYNKNFASALNEDPSIELSRILIQFDLSDLKSRLEKYTDITSDKFKIELVLKDIQGTQLAPKDFTLGLYQVSGSMWKEGLGNDVYSFAKEDFANWNSASVDIPWENKGGDYYSSPITTQTFTEGHEDLKLDITSWCVSSMNSSVGFDNLGWIIKLSDDNETDELTYFVKRFASRNNAKKIYRPHLLVSIDNYFGQSRQNFYTDQENILDIQYYNSQGNFQPILTDLTASLSYNNWLSTGSVSTVSIGGLETQGWYKAVFQPIDIYSNDLDLKDALLVNNKLELTETWTDQNGKVFYSGSVELRNLQASTTSLGDNWRFTVKEGRNQYANNSMVRIKIFARDKKRSDESIRIPIRLPSLVIEECYYQIRDLNDNSILVPFSYGDDWSTRISNDADGLYFDFNTEILELGHTYTCDILYIENGITKTDNLNISFKVK